MGEFKGSKGKVTAKENQKWDLCIDDRHKMLSEIADKLYKELKRDIGNRIFSTYSVWKEKDDSFFIAKKIHESIFRYEDDPIGINLKFKLQMSGFNLFNDVISKEYGMILSQATEIEELKRRLNFYEQYHSIPGVNPTQS